VSLLVIIAIGIFALGMILIMRRLAASEARYRRLFERNLAGVYVATEGGSVIDCNDACARLFGYSSRESFIGAAGRIEYMHAAERESLLDRLRDEGAVANEQVELRGRDGAAVWALEITETVAMQTSGRALKMLEHLRAMGMAIVITAVLMLANHLGLRTVAEGVETEEQAAFLREHDCREIHGYLVSEALQAAAFAERFLERRDPERVARAATV
jgi:PAS domain S-box-containing protein